ncbi:MAG: dTMP kinase [Candidatus Eisenbacteria bacterium]|nr:dTMP kinase [Candidatus Eisenbacteria bacterium]
MSGGCFITFEGVEGSGKSTQLRAVEVALRAAGRRVVVCREPGGTSLGEAIRKLLLEEAADPPAELTELLLLEASRAHLVDRVIRPALRRSEVVLCDRFADASLAYQWGGRGLDRRLVSRLNDVAVRDCRPRRTLLFDLDPRHGLARRRRGGWAADRMEREDPAFHDRVRRAYLTLAQEEPDRFVILNAAQAPATLAAEIRRILEPLLGSLPPASGREERSDAS